MTIGMAFGAYASGEKDNLLIAFPYLATSAKILKSGNGKRWKDTGATAFPFPPVSRKYKQRVAFLDNWCYFSVNDTIWKTQDFIIFTQVVPSGSPFAVPGFFMEDSFTAEHNGVLYFVGSYQLNGGGIWVHYVYRSTDVGINWDKVLTSSPIPQGASGECDLIFSTNFMLMTEGNYGYPTAEFGKLRGHPTGAFGTEDTPGTFAKGGAPTVFANDGGLFADGVFYFPSNNRLSVVPENGLNGGAGASYPFTDITNCSQLAYCPMLGMVSAIGYKSTAGGRELHIEYWEIGVGGPTAAIVPAFLTGNAHNPFMSICALPQGGIVACMSEGSFSSTEPCILLHSPDGLTYSEVQPSGSFKALSALYQNLIA